MNKRQEQAQAVVASWLEVSRFVRPPQPSSSVRPWEFRRPIEFMPVPALTRDGLALEMRSTIEQAGLHAIRGLTASVVAAAVAEVMPWAPPGLAALVTEALVVVIEEEFGSQTLTPGERIGILAAAGVGAILIAGLFRGGSGAAA